VELKHVEIKAVIEGVVSFNPTNSGIETQIANLDPDVISPFNPTNSGIETFSQDRCPADSIQPLIRPIVELKLVTFCNTRVEVITL